MSQVAFVPRDAAMRAHEAAALLARRDFHAFCEYVGVDDAGRPIRQHALHGLIWSFSDWCARRGFHAGIMCPMGHGKTSQFQLRAAWEIGREPNTLCRIVTAAEKGALERANAVRQIMELPRYRIVFPHLEIARGEESDAEFTLRRSGVSKEPTLGCSGVQTGTGSRCTLLMLDDIVDIRNAILQPADRDRVAQSFEQIWMSRPIPGRSRVLWIQTAYHVDDIAHRTQRRSDSGWAWLIARAEPPYEELRYEVLVRGAVAATGAIPNFIATPELRRLADSMNTIAAARGLGNRAITGAEQPFQPALFESAPPLPLERYPRRVAYADPAGDPRKARTGDPDWCAIACVGKHPSEQAWDLVRSERRRGTSQDQADFLADRVVEWGVQVLYVEAVADSAMPTLVRQACLKRGRYIPVERAQPRRNKEVRIQEELEPRLRQGLLRISASSHRELVQELLVFPMGSHDDLADAAAGAAQHAMGHGPARSASSRPKLPASEASSRAIRRVPPRIRPRVFDDANLDDA